MSRLLDDPDLEDMRDQRDRELTLSTGAILAIFLGLILLCAVFFGFGYNLGRKSTVAVPAAATTSANEPSPSAPSSTFDNFKPSPSSPAASHETTRTLTPVAPPPPTPTSTAPPSATPHERSPAPQSASPAPARTATSATSMPAAVPTGTFVVQVAAVSRKDDADLLLSALHAKGYTVAAHSTPQDKLLHIQVGPFATRKDAEAMRERLIMDGYNAIVK